MNLAYYERKCIRITLKSIIMHKNNINNSRTTSCKMDVSPPIKGVKLGEGLADVVLDDTPTSVQELDGKTV